MTLAYGIMHSAGTVVSDLLEAHLFLQLQRNIHSHFTLVYDMIDSVGYCVHKLFCGSYYGGNITAILLSCCPSEKKDQY